MAIGDVKEKHLLEAILARSEILESVKKMIKMGDEYESNVIRTFLHKTPDNLKDFIQDYSILEKLLYKEKISIVLEGNDIGKYYFEDKFLTQNKFKLLEKKWNGNVIINLTFFPINLSRDEKKLEIKFELVFLEIKE